MNCLRFEVSTSSLKRMSPKGRLLYIKCMNDLRFSDFSSGYNYQTNKVSTKVNTLYLFLILKFQVPFKYLRILSFHLLTNPIGMATSSHEDTGAPELLRTLSVVFLVLLVQGGKEQHLPLMSQLLTAVFYHYFLKHCCS